MGEDAHVIDFCGQDDKPYWCGFENSTSMALSDDFGGGREMRVRDNGLKRDVDVCHGECPARECYWPRPDPGVFTPGKGYKSRGSKPSGEYICGTRAIHGCPDKYCR